ncbi:MAG TPA: DNA repair protein RecO [Candidatus Paceibacterota bacterium]
MPYRIYNTKAVILKSSPHGEADKNIIMLTEDLGLIRAQAKGVRYEKSKLNSKLQEMNLSEVGLVRGKNSWRLTSAIGIQNYFRLLRNQKSKVQVFSRVLNLILQLIHGEEKNSHLFNLIADAGNFLIKKNLSTNEIMIFELILVLRVLEQLGYINQRGELKELTNSSWGEAIAIGEKSKQKIVAGINNALKESHLGV